MTKLKEKREKMGMSQSMLAKKTGISLKTIQFYEQGLRDINKAQANTLYKLSVCLGCTIEDLIDTDTILEKN